MVTFKDYYDGLRGLNVFDGFYSTAITNRYCFIVAVGSFVKLAPEFDTTLAAAFWSFRMPQVHLVLELEELFHMCFTHP